MTKNAEFKINSTAHQTIVETLIKNNVGKSDFCFFQGNLNLNDFYTGKIKFLNKTIIYKRLSNNQSFNIPTIVYQVIN